MILLVFPKNYTQLKRILTAQGSTVREQLKNRGMLTYPFLSWPRGFAHDFPRRGS